MAGAAVGTEPRVGRWQSHSETIPSHSPGASGKLGVLRDGRMIKNKRNQAEGTEPLDKIPSRNVEE